MSHRQQSKLGYQLGGRVLGPRGQQKTTLRNSGNQVMGGSKVGSISNQPWPMNQPMGWTVAECVEANHPGNLHSLCVRMASDSHTAIASTGGGGMGAYDLMSSGNTTWDPLPPVGGVCGYNQDGVAMCACGGGACLPGCCGGGGGEEHVHVAKQYGGQAGMGNNNAMGWFGGGPRRHKKRKKVRRPMRGR